MAEAVATTQESTTTAAGTATGTTASAAGTQQAAQQSTQQTDTTRTGAGTTGADKSFSYKEDRTAWIPPHRLSETTGKLSAAETENKRLQDQIRALTGTQVPNPDEQKTAQIKDAMFQMFPWAKKFNELSPEQQDRVFSAADRLDSTEEMITQGQARHAKTMFKTLVDSYSDLGGSLSDGAQKRLKVGFTQMIEEEVNKSRQSGAVTETLQRYMDGDDKLAGEFANAWFDDFGKPARRQITQQELNRSPRVPNSTGRGQVTQTVKPEKFNSWDERLEYATKVGKERGMTFGREQ